MSSSCVAVLIGIPAAGKTTFCESLVNYVNGNTAWSDVWIVKHVCYDELLADRAHWLSPDYVWKKDRQNIIREVEQILTNHSEAAIQKRLLLLVDDNFYYASMRRVYWRLCAQLRVCFCQFYVPCSIDTAIGRNSTRLDADWVSDIVIKRMFERLEPPEHTDSWQRDCSLVIETSDSDSPDFARIFSFIETLQPVNLPDQEQLSQVRNASREQCANSVKHQLDLTVRECIAEIIVELKSDKSKIQRVVNVKNEILAKFKSGELVCADPKEEKRHLSDVIREMAGIL